MQSQQAALSVPRVIGHRGAAQAAPENTLEGFIEAKAQGASWVEFDAKLTADNAVILLHDDIVDRTTNGMGFAAQMSLSALQALDAGSWFGPAWANSRIPTLAETIACLERLELGCNVEIKPCPGRDRETAVGVLDELGRVWPTAKPLPLVSSFSYESLLEARRINEARPGAGFPLGLLLEDAPADWLGLAQELGAVSIHCWHEALTQDWARAIKQAGYLLLVYTVNDVNLARQLFAWGVDAVFTDVPGRLLAEIGR
ncbi:glycerophosphoryl diester phosphodiesterase [Dongia soli]|uniref:Glycerophosphoryl diester phosphodiesterase n=1 Tax=Dongia soli TaxID=600628 RepID=A0ABU5E6R7_9PROT|nr:glycerophosphoryl diester phosphodiesterase [Dongia soli]MDY0881834.1 glycerophosphoryl diester phosphodiesterase [Dongia soli]